MERTPPLILLLSAPSGGGKTTVMQGMLAAQARLRRVVTCTTRPPRAGERDGVDYHFFTREEFDRRVAAGEFLEHAEVYGNGYGTLRSGVLELLQGGWDVILSLDVQGAATFQRLAQGEAVLRGALVTVFLTPRTTGELTRRLRGRGSESEDAVARRLLAAREEIGRWESFDYLVLSGTREEDLERVRCIYLAEKLRSCRAEFVLEDGSAAG